MRDGFEHTVAERAEDKTNVHAITGHLREKLFQGSSCCRENEPVARCDFST